MNWDAGEDGGHSGRPVRTDGGPPEPGVPGENESASDSDESGSGAGETTRPSSGSQMPGVPESNGEKPAVESDDSSVETSNVEGPGEAGEPELTTVFTLAALTRLTAPAEVISEARTWSDWVGVVGEADAPTINTFLRREGIDTDFFNGVAEPAERLARVAAEGSAFHADRLVLVGVEGQEAIAETAGWEFEGVVPTAEEAGWELA